MKANGTPDDGEFINPRFGGEASSFDHDELAELAHSHAGADDPTRPSVSQIRDAMERGTYKDAPGTGNRVQIDYKGVRVIINEDNPFRSTAYLP